MLAIRYRETAALVRQVFFLRYALIFAVILAAMLAAVYYNVGLGLRQRTMYIPPLIALFVAITAVRRARRNALSPGSVAPAA
jgi:ABC-type polysaccharide transport system permease subunit